MDTTRQGSVCERAGAVPLQPLPASKIGIALSSLGAIPIHGMRCPPTATTNGWYVFCGDEMSRDPDFFVPLHIEHLPQYLPSIIEYLDLPPGYRFLIDGLGYEDVWFDESLLREVADVATAK